VTLNITVAARWLMAQSSDFRLTSDSGSILVSDTVQKQVVLHYLGWSGLVCYTGVGRYGVHDTAEWLGQVLHNDLGQQAPGQIVRMLAEKGNIWLHRLRRVPAKDRIHTFTMISFERGNPYIYVISN